MFDTYKIMYIDDTNLGYRLKNKYFVLKFTGADSKQIPIYNLVKKFRTEQRAKDYIDCQSAAG